MAKVGGAQFREFSYDGSLHYVANPRGLVGRFFKEKNRCAMTWGAVVVFQDYAVRTNTVAIRHEHFHVRQMMILRDAVGCWYAHKQSAGKNRRITGANE